MEERDLVNCPAGGGVTGAAGKEVDADEAMAARMGEARDAGGKGRGGWKERRSGAAVGDGEGTSRL